MNYFQIDMHKNFIGIIEENFLSLKETEDIKNKVLNHSKFWTNFYHTKIFPPGIAYRKDRKDIYKTEVENFQSILENNFSNVYEKISEKVSNIFNCRCNFVLDKHKPGFHIWGPGPYTHSHIHYHVDQFTGIRDKIYSFTIPISLPTEPTGLNYVDPLQTYPKYTTKEMFHKQYAKTIFYKIGCLVMTDGLVMHSIKPFILNENEYRITIQFHVGLKKDNPDESFIFW
jgi:hypothetical protein